METSLTSQDFKPINTNGKVSYMPQGILTSTYKNNLKTCSRETTLVYNTKSRVKINQFFKREISVDAFLKLLVFGVFLVSVV